MDMDPDILDHFVNNPKSYTGTIANYKLTQEDKRREAKAKKDLERMQKEEDDLGFSMGQDLSQFRNSTGSTGFGLKSDAHKKKKQPSEDDDLAGEMDDLLNEIGDSDDGAPKKKQPQRPKTSTGIAVDTSKSTESIPKDRQAKTAGKQKTKVADPFDFGLDDDDLGVTSENHSEEEEDDDEDDEPGYDPTASRSVSRPTTGGARLPSAGGNQLTEEQMKRKREMFFGGGGGGSGSRAGSVTGGDGQDSARKMTPVSSNRNLRDGQNSTTSQGSQQYQNQQNQQQIQRPSTSAGSGQQNQKQKNISLSDSDDDLPIMPSRRNNRLPSKGQQNAQARTFTATGSNRMTDEVDSRPQNEIARPSTGYGMKRDAAQDNDFPLQNERPGIDRDDSRISRGGNISIDDGDDDENFPSRRNRGRKPLSREGSRTGAGLQGRANPITTTTDNIRSTSGSVEREREVPSFLRDDQDTTSSGRRTTEVIQPRTRRPFTTASGGIGDSAPVGSIGLGGNAIPQRHVIREESREVTARDLTEFQDLMNRRIRFEAFQASMSISRAEFDSQLRLCLDFENGFKNLMDDRNKLLREMESIRENYEHEKSLMEKKVDHEADRAEKVEKRHKETVEDLRKIHEDKFKSLTEMQNKTVTMMEDDKIRALEELTAAYNAERENTKMRHQADLEELKRQNQDNLDAQKRLYEQQNSLLQKQFSQSATLTTLEEKLKTSSNFLEQLTSQYQATQESELHQLQRDVQEKQRSLDQLAQRLDLESSRVSKEKERLEQREQAISESQQSSAQNFEEEKRRLTDDRDRLQDLHDRFMFEQKERSEKMVLEERRLENFKNQIEFEKQEGLRDIMEREKQVEFDRKLFDDEQKEFMIFRDKETKNMQAKKYEIEQRLKNTKETESEIMRKRRITEEKEEQIEREYYELQQKVEQLKVDKQTYDQEAAKVHQISLKLEEESQAIRAIKDNFDQDREELQALKNSIDAKQATILSDEKRFDDKRDQLKQLQKSLEQMRAKTVKEMLDHETAFTISVPQTAASHRVATPFTGQTLDPATMMRPQTGGVLYPIPMDGGRNLGTGRTLTSHTTEKRPATGFRSDEYIRRIKELNGERARDEVSDRFVMKENQYLMKMKMEAETGYSNILRATYSQSSSENSLYAQDFLASSHQEGNYKSMVSSGSMKTSEGLDIGMLGRRGHYSPEKSTTPTVGVEGISTLDANGSNLDETGKFVQGE